MKFFSQIKLGVVVGFRKFKSRGHHRGHESKKVGVTIGVTNSKTRGRGRGHPYRC